MKRLLVLKADSSGCFLHRLELPHKKMAELTKDFEITITDLSELGLKTNEDIIPVLTKIGTGYDALVYHRCLEPLYIDFFRKNYPNLKLIIDMDDYWNLTQQHACFSTYKIFNIKDKIEYCFKNADLVTCTTSILADIIKPYNPNIAILPNSLCAEGEFAPHPNPSNRIRFGLIGGSSHIRDIEMLYGIANRCSPELLSQIQFVLCGFDRGTTRLVDENKRVVGEQQMPWENVCWTRFERILTNDYRIVSPEHKKFLQEFRWQQQYNADEPYKRIWTKDIYHYMNCYDDIDVLLVPLEDNEFNRYKSELKLVEASIKNKCVIVSDVNPYKICGINIIDKGGEINPEGNCYMINNRKGSMGWYKAIKRVATDEKLRDMMRTNLSKLTEKDYNLEEVTKKRIEEYKKLWPSD